MQLNINRKTLILNGDFTNNDMVWNNILQSVSDAGLHIVGMVKHNFYPQGFSGVVLISESHIIIHTYPENKEAWVDVGTCDGSWDKIDLLADNLGKHWVYYELDRTLL